MLTCNLPETITLHLRNVVFTAKLAGAKLTEEYPLEVPHEKA
jgi:hypothetical protein